MDMVDMIFHVWNVSQDSSVHNVGTGCPFALGLILRYFYLLLFKLFVVWPQNIYVTAVPLPNSEILRQDHTVPTSHLRAERLLLGLLGCGRIRSVSSFKSLLKTLFFSKGLLIIFL